MALGPLATVARSMLKLSVGLVTLKKFRVRVPEPIPRTRPPEPGSDTWLPAVAGT